MKILSTYRSAALAAAVILAPFSTLAQSNLSGTWTLNGAASELGQVRAPKSDVMTIHHHGKSFAWSEVIVMPNGSIEKEAWGGAMDGVARPVKGAPGSRASYKPDGSGRWTSPEGDSDLLATLSADGRQLILTSTTPLPGGKVMKQKFVYDRTK